MEQNANKVKATLPKNRVSTKLKFVKSDEADTFISFVSQNPVNNAICGVRDDSPYPKKIVIIDCRLKKDILVNTLYDCVLVPMGKTRNEATGKKHIPGYIAISATPVQFKATISTNYIRGVKYNVEVAFGNKVVLFDPFKGKKESVKSLLACRAVLEKRCDVKDLLTVVKDFETAANSLLALMKEDMRQIHNKKKDYGQTNRGYRN